MAFDLDPVEVMKVLRKEGSSSGFSGPDPNAFKGIMPNAAKHQKQQFTPKMEPGLSGISFGADEALYQAKVLDNQFTNELRMAGDMLGNKANEEMAYRNRLANERYARKRYQGEQDAAWLQAGGTILGTVAGVLI